jgi:hypothetical protein
VTVDGKTIHRQFAVSTSGQELSRKSVTLTHSIANEEDDVLCDRL